MPGNRWTQKEFEVTVKLYCEMWKAQDAGSTIHIADYVRKCIAELKASRGYNSVRRRFSNISYVFEWKKIRIVEGLKPLANISENDRDLIWEIAENELGEKK